MRYMYIVTLVWQADRRPISSEQHINLLGRIITEYLAKFLSPNKN